MMTSMYCLAVGFAGPGLDPLGSQIRSCCSGASDSVTYVICCGTDRTGWAVSGSQRSEKLFCSMTGPDLSLVVHVPPTSLSVIFRRSFVCPWTSVITKLCTIVHVVLRTSMTGIVLAALTYG
jgi:hypothetical protein